MRRAIVSALVALTLGSAPSGAQDWATAEVCTVDEAVVDASVFLPDGLAALETHASTIPNANGKLWRITSADGAVSHLWGTYHSSDPLILALPEAVTAAIDAARVVAVEVDYTFKSRDDYRRSQDMEGRFKEASDPFAFTPGDGAIAGLSPEISYWIRDRAIELGWTEDVDLILSLPGIAEMLLADPCEDFTQGILPIQDDYVLLLGRLAGTEILGLEDPDEFVADLGNNEETARAIIATYAAYLKPMESNAERATGFALYLQGRLGVMEAWDHAFQRQIYGPAGVETQQKTDAYLLAFRNERFLERVADDLAKGGVVIAVGAAHIPGDTGLVALLRKGGYTVERIPLPGEVP